MLKFILILQFMIVRDNFVVTNGDKQRQIWSVSCIKHTCINDYLHMYHKHDLDTPTYTRECVAAVSLHISDA